MRDPSKILLVLLLVGVFLLTQSDKVPHWLSYSLMLAGLGSSRWLAPEWFEESWFTTLWRVALAVVGVGLLLEVFTA